jgi:molecular chaperone DnaK
MDADVVLGIDLGTTYTSAAVVIGDRLQTVRDEWGDIAIPSVVHFPAQGPPVVGRPAAEMRARDPQNTVFGVKRLVGRSATSSGARLLDAMAAFRIKSLGNARCGVEVQTGVYSAEEVAATLLKYVRERAEAQFKRRIRKAVVAVPVTADAQVRKAMTQVGAIAGLEVVRMVLEPCAGAIAQGFTETSLDPAPMLVYDFGGGTFDAAVIQRRGMVLSALASAGDESLGGDTFDMAFARWVANGIFRVSNRDVTHDAVIWDAIQRQCEQVKRALSTSERATFRLEEGIGGSTPARRFELELTRAMLASEWNPLVERSLQTAATAVVRAGLKGTDLSAVLLIGGTSQMPQVREGVARVFPNRSLIDFEPQTVVARGAAKLAADPELLTE